MDIDILQALAFPKSIEKLNNFHAIFNLYLTLVREKFEERK
jgi:uracil phosphoribosyltransferase